MLIDHEPIDLLKILTGKTEFDVIVTLLQRLIPEAIHVEFRQVCGHVCGV